MASTDPHTETKMMEPLDEFTMKLANQPDATDRSGVCFKCVRSKVPRFCGVSANFSSNSRFLVLIPFSGEGRARGSRACSVL